MNYFIFLGNIVYLLFLFNVCYNGIVNVDNVSYVVKIEFYCEFRYLGLVSSIIIKLIKRFIGIDFTNFFLLGVLFGKNDIDIFDTFLINLNGLVISVFFENIFILIEMFFVNVIFMVMLNIIGEVI